MSLLAASKQYKPFEYPWAFEFWKRQQQLHWLPEEVPLGEDCRDWAQKLTPHERNLLTQIFRFFTQADVEVQDCYHEKYGRVFKPTEIKMMLTAFSNMETVHIAAYSHLLDTIGMPESEYGAFLEYGEMKDKHDYMQNFGVDTDEDIARTLAMFGGFTEGVQLFASFAMLMNFPRFNKMKGMGQIVSWSVRDESLHCEGIIKMFHAFCAERQCLTKAVKDDIADVCQTTIRLEDNFIDLAFEMGPVNGMTPREIKKYIRFIADWRMGQLGLKPIYMIDEHPLPWLAPLLNGVEHANFFETRATEYSKAATQAASGTTSGTASTSARPRRGASRPPTRMPARAATCSPQRVSRRSNRPNDRARRSGANDLRRPDRRRPPTPAQHGHHRGGRPCPTGRRPHTVRKASRRPSSERTDAAGSKRRHRRVLRPIHGRDPWRASRPQRRSGCRRGDAGAALRLGRMPVRKARSILLASFDTSTAWAGDEQNGHRCNAAVAAAFCVMSQSGGNS